MMVVRAYVLILTFGIFIGSNVVLAEVRLPDTAFQDWAGVVDTSSLPDGTELSEYAARTFSGRVEGAMLALSFVPRFECAPMVSLRLPGTIDGISADPIVEISVGGVRQQYRGYVDRDGKYLMLSLAGTLDQLQQLRQIIDESPRASFRLLPESVAQEQTKGDNSDGPHDLGNETGGVVFSLLGSQNATLAVENHCKSHEPAAYQPLSVNAEDL